MATLFVHHQIYLNKEEVNELNNKKTLTIRGVCIPVWFHKKDTSEPAEELFCNYILKNNKINKKVMVLKDEEMPIGYKIYLPQVPKSYKPREMSNESWREMTPDEQNMWFYDHPVPDSIENLLDVKDGGNEYLSFDYKDRFPVEDEKYVTIRHCVEIKRTENLMKTLEAF